MADGKLVVTMGPGRSRKEFSPGSSTAMRQVQTTWLEQTLPAAIANAMTLMAANFPGTGTLTYNPRTTQTVTTVDGLSSAQVYCYDNTQAFNNQTDVWEYGFGFGTLPASGACPAAASGYARHKHTSYWTDSAYLTDAVHLVSLPTTQQVMDGGDNVIAETDYTYDLTAIGAESSITQHTSTVSTSFPAFGTAYTTRGNVTGVSRRVSISTSIGTSATYDIAGNTLTTTDGSQHTTSYGYGDSWGATSTVWGGSPSSGDTYAFPVTVQVVGKARSQKPRRIFTLDLDLC